MPTRKWSGAWYPDDGDDFDVAEIAEQMQDSLDRGVIPRFTSAGARDTAFAAIGSELTATEKRGVVAYVDGLGLCYYTGSIWRRVASHGENFVQSGTTLVNCEPTGLAAIVFPTPFGGKPIVTTTRLTVIYGVEGLTVAINDEGTANVTSSYFHVYVTKRNTSPPYGDVPYDDWVHISWIAHGPRTTD